MKIAVLSTAVDSWESRRISREITKLGHEATRTSFQGSYVSVGMSYNDNGNGTVTLQKFMAAQKRIMRQDVLIPRVGRHYYLTLAYMILKQMEAIGKPATLSADSLLNCKNKFLCMQQLTLAGVPVPKSFLIGPSVPLDSPLKQLPGPYVLKLLDRSKGIGAIKLNSRVEARMHIREAQTLGSNHSTALQECIPNRGDLRLFWIGDRVVAAMKRTAKKGEWRSNYSRGGFIEPHEPTSDEEKITARAAKALGIEIGGIDVIENKNNGHLYVLEINSNPGFSGIMKATHINIPRLMVEYAITKGKR